MSFRAAVEAFEMMPPTGAGRSYSARRRVRLGDATPRGRMRLDAVARFLQDVANDDSRDAEWSDPHWWVVRRTVVDVHDFPSYLQEVDIATWCGGLGSHWAERRTRLSAIDGRPMIDAASLWVHVDSDTLHPCRIPADVVASLEDAAAGRMVNARLFLKSAMFDEHRSSSTPWPLRFSDFDAVGHMNNAAYWEIIEERLAAKGTLRPPLRAVMEHVMQVEPGQQLQCQTMEGNDDIAVQMVVGSQVHAAAWCGPLSQ